MRIIRNILIAVLALCFAACNNENDPFSGTDNFINSFVLSQEGITYNGIFEGDKIIVYLHEGMLAQGIKATVELSENARISPDPEMIENWMEEYQFVVTSYNGNKRSYFYTPQFSNIEHIGDVILRTQEDVDAFPNLGITAINGNLIIGNSTGEDSISSVSALSSLKKVDYDVIINSCYKGEQLVLAGLEEAGSITVNPTVDFGIVSFPNLKKVNLTANFGSLYQLSCPNLETVGKDLTVSNLSTMYFALSFPNLTKVEGTLTINNTNYQINSFSLPKLEEVGTLTLSFYANNIRLPALKTASTALSISGTNILAIDLPLFQKGGNITISATNLVKLNMPLLQEAGNISYSNLKINEVDFSKLTNAGNISLSSVVNVASIQFPLLQEAGNLTFSTATKLRNLDLGSANIRSLNLSSIDTISVKGSGVMSGSLGISSYVYYCKVEGIREMAILQSSSSATHLECIGLKKITNHAYVALFDEGKILLPDLEKIENYLTFQCYSVKEIGQGDINLGKLETMGGKLTISGSNNAPYFTNLNMFSPLKSAASVQITNLKALTDYSGLKNMINSIDATKWSVSGNAYNPTYQDLLDAKWTNQ